MQKKFSINLTIPTPCHENWENMTPNEQGKHCKSCNKTVIDFSLFTDKQLLEFFSKVTGNICGRLTNFQTNRQLVYVEPARNHFLYKLLFGTALVAGIASANANYNPNTKPLIENYDLHKPGEAPQGDTTHFITGTVIDSTTSKPIANVLVAIKGTTEPVQTDGNGHFKVFVPLKYRYKTIRLQCVSGFYEQEIDVTTRKLPKSVTIKLIHTQAPIVCRSSAPQQHDVGTITVGTIDRVEYKQVAVKTEEPFDPFVNADKQILKFDQ
ncbi:MAG TPA: carboxypeptidase-like regulatory domain-containing protein [Bacteroidia bacterium]|jgi:hypothetical protein|nr:carboxypeptidase-like regulatory domain-containing protein [Bacteroidia bacterium]